jgi:hypothetical protein
MNICMVPNIFSMFDMTILDIGFSPGVKVPTFVFWNGAHLDWSYIYYFLIGNILLTNGLTSVFTWPGSDGDWRDLLKGADQRGLGFCTCYYFKGKLQVYLDTPLYWCTTISKIVTPNSNIPLPTFRGLIHSPWRRGGGLKLTMAKGWPQYTLVDFIPLARD